MPTPLLTGVLKAAASSILGNKLKQAAQEKVIGVVREKLDLPPEVTEDAIEVKLLENPKVYAELVAVAATIRQAQEETHRVAMTEQGATDRVALSSEHAFVRNARPMMLYLGGLSCFGVIASGVAIAVFAPQSLGDFTELVGAIMVPLTALLTAGGVYAYRRTTDKAIQRGLELPPLLSIGQ